MFESNGVHVLRPAIKSPCRTVAIVGLVRGGTTMVAKAVAGLGVPLGGENIPTVEDPEFVHALNGGRGYQLNAAVDMSAVLGLIARRNTINEVWGFKVPGNIFPDVYDQLRNPHIIAVFRDPVAIAKREAVSTRTELKPHFRHAAILQARIADYLASTELPCLLVSYEKALAAPRVFVDAVAEFLNVPPTDEAYAAIQRSPEAYRRATARASSPA